MNSSSTPIRQSKISTATNSNQKSQDGQSILDLTKASFKEKRKLLFILGNYKGIEDNQDLPTTKQLEAKLGVTIKTARK